MQPLGPNAVRATNCLKRRMGPLIAMALALWAPGCSSFNRAWKAANPEQAAPETMAGRWEGRWHSEVNDHNDRLRAIITPQTNGTYSARFHAEYKRVFRFRFSYTVPLRVTSEKDRWRFQGEADLGWYAGGKYSYQGFATATNFFSTYRSKHDHGTFHMTRPPVR
jgi:hypothetical protein